MDFAYNHYSHLIFPTLVLETKHNNHEFIKDLYFEKAFKYMDENGYSFEETHNCIHHEESLKDLFIFATKSAQKYLDLMNIEYNLFDFNLIKSWMNIVHERGNIPHAHYESHLSFVYYVNIPKGMEIPIRFYLSHHQKNVPWQKMYELAKIKNEANSFMCDFYPKEGMMLVFPSSLYHGAFGNNGDIKDAFSTNLNELKKRRISIAGDFILTFKDTTLVPAGIQPVKNWRLFC